MNVRLLCKQLSIAETMITRHHLFQVYLEVLIPQPLVFKYHANTMLDWLLSLLLPIPLANSITLSRETDYIFSHQFRWCPSSVFNHCIAKARVNIIDGLRDPGPYWESRPRKENHFACTLFQACKSFCKNKGREMSFWKGNGMAREWKIWSWSWYLLIYTLTIGMPFFFFLILVEQMPSASKSHPLVSARDSRLFSFTA